MPRTLQIILFAVIQLPLLPVSVAGYLYIVARTMIMTKKLGISATSAGMVVTRWKMDVFGVRSDTTTRKMAGALPFLSTPALWLAIGPAWIAHKICGFVPRRAGFVEPAKASLATLINSRTPLFDHIMERHLGRMEQVVIMGAGFDSRAFKYCRNRNIRVFELDRANTLGLKAKALKISGVDMDEGWFSFVPVDFNHEPWADKLIARGYDPRQRTLFLWEGVTLYLDEVTVRNTLKRMAASGGSGSIVAVDFYSREFVNYEIFFLLKYIGKNLLRISGEPLKFGIDTAGDFRDGIRPLLQEAGFSPVELIPLGKSGAGKNPFAMIVEAIKM